MELIDNINTLFGDRLKQDLSDTSKVRIAAATFSIFAYEALKQELQQVESLEFIFTSPTFTPDESTDILRKEKREFHIPKLDRERSLYGTEFEIKLRNGLTQRAIAKECADWIRRKARFKSNITQSNLNGFASVANGDSYSTYISVTGFSAVDLGYQQGNSFSNFVHRFDDSSQSASYLSVFNQLWNDASKVKDITETLIEHIESVYQENSPERIYFLILYNIFNEFLDDLNEDILPNDRTGYKDTEIWKQLFNFQRDAATGIINKLETYNGCILADSVGLGKTFTALAVIKYYELRNRSVLVLCPKKLSDNWQTYNRNLKTNLLAKDRFNYDVLCHTDLQRDSGYSLGTPLDRVNWGNYDLIVIDESHNFRNNAAFKDRETRYQQLLNRVIREGVKTKVLMLSATPVNNRFSDLKNQLALAYEGDPAQLQSKLKTTRDIDSIFARAQAAFNSWSKLPPNERTPVAILQSLDFDFFELLDSVTIARSRKHIQTYYDTTAVGQFPERRKPLSFHCKLTDRPDVIGFNDIFAELSRLKMSVYAPFSYILPSRLKKYEEIYDTDVRGGQGRLQQKDRERSLQALMITNLLKRLESSVASFRLTLRSLADRILDNLNTIHEFQATGRAADISDIVSSYENMEDEEDDFDGPAGSTAGKIKVSLTDMDLPSWTRDLRADLEGIELLLSEMEKISPSDDKKLQHLKQLILEKIRNPINEGNRKVIVFTAFADTADYLYQNLSHNLLQAESIHSAKITGSTHPRSTLSKGYDFQTLLTLFSPVSKNKELVIPGEAAAVDLLIATDCISEGQNLQDCDYLINYDIHWNPVRIIQRFGRIDRIGSKNEVIQLVNYWPDITLDEYINLKDRVESRMIITDVTAGGDDNVLRNESSELAYRKEQLKRLQDEVIEMEDVKTGVSITDLGLNDFRMDLLHYNKENGDISKLPNGMHAVIPCDPENGFPPGVIFALRNRNHTVNVDQQNRLHPYYLIYISKDGEVQIRHTDAKRMLDVIRRGCKGRAEPIREVYSSFNKTTKDGRKMDSYSELLQQCIRSIIDVKEDNDIDSLFSGSKTTALLNEVKGLDDFELIAFIVVQ